MACSACGGTDRAPIAPGYWRCTSLRRIVTEVGGPGLTNPFAGPPVIQIEQLVECGTEYQEGGAVSVEECSCGTFAIGRCGECRRPVCGSHSGLWEGRRLCEPHLGAAQAAAQEQQAEAQTRAVADAIATSVRSWDEWLAAARAALAQTPDPVERTVRVVAALSGGSWPGRLPEDRLPLLTLLLPEQLAGLEPDVLWWWDHDAVQAWFLRAVKVPPQQLEVVHVRTTLFGGTKSVRATVPGWAFPNGSTVGSRNLHMRWWSSVSVLADGGRLLGANPERPDAGFNETALTLMAELTQLELLPAFPPVGFRHPQTRARIWPA